MDSLNGLSIFTDGLNIKKDIVDKILRDENISHLEIYQLEEKLKNCIIFKLLKRVGYQNLNDPSDTLNVDEKVIVRRKLCGIVRSDKYLAFIDNFNKIILENRETRVPDKKDEDYTINVDDMNSGHIRSAVQNLILYFGKMDKMFMVKEGQQIATIASMTDFKNTTQSHLWVPLIWKALTNLGKVSVPEKWYKLPNDKLNQAVHMLQNLEGWADYAIKILSTKYNYSDLKGNNNFDNDFIKKESERVTKLILSEKSLVGGTRNIKNDYYKKYLTFKRKYLYLKLKIKMNDE